MKRNGVDVVVRYRLGLGCAHGRLLSLIVDVLSHGLGHGLGNILVPGRLADLGQTSLQFPGDPERHNDRRRITGLGRLGWLNRLGTGFRLAYGYDFIFGSHE